jgi:hypothetical protein
MSLLGIDAIGHLAIGQVQALQSAVLPALTGSFIETGIAATFKHSAVSSPTSYVISAQPANLSTVLLAASVSFTETGNSAPLTIALTAVKATYTLIGMPATFNGSGAALGMGSYVVTGNAAALTISLGASSGSYVIAGRSAVLSRDFINWVHDGAPSNQWTIKQPPPLTVVWTPH